MPFDLGPLIREFAATLNELEDADSTIERIVTLTADVVGTDLGSVTFPKRGRFVTHSPSQIVVAEAEQQQLALGEGPSFRRYDSPRVRHSKDVTVDERWQIWGKAAAELGIKSAVTIDMRANARHIASLNLYGTTVDAFDQEALERAVVFAEVGAGTLGCMEEVESLTNAIDTRSLIGQAQGILMQRYGFERERAFSVLRRHSQNRNVKLVDVAASVVRGDPIE